MTPKLYKAFMKTAYAFADCSYAKRLKVGCIIVKDNRIISIGYNGTPTGWDNDCEIEVFFHEETGKQLVEPMLITRDEVLHAETNAIAKLAMSHESGKGAALFTTHAPCLQCSKLIYQSGIEAVYYAEEYRNSDGIDFLKACGIETQNTTEDAE